MWIGHKYFGVCFRLGYVAHICCTEISEWSINILTVEKLGIAPEIVSDMAMDSSVVEYRSIPTKFPFLKDSSGSDKH